MPGLPPALRLPSLALSLLALAPAISASAGTGVLGWGTLESDLDSWGRQQRTPFEDGPEVLKRFDRDAESGPRALVSAHYDLLAAIDLEFHLAEEFYRQRGYADLLPFDLESASKPLLERIARRREVLLDEVSRSALRAPQGKAKAIARLILDPRIHVHLAIWEDIQLDRRNLQGGIRLLHGAARGYGALQEDDRRRVVQGMNLAAARLEVALLDLKHLSQPLTDASFPHADETEFGEILERGMGKADGSRVRRILSWAKGETSATKDGLALVDFDRQQGPQLQERSLGMRRSRALWREVDVLAPFSPAGMNAPPEIANLTKKQRMARLLQKSLEAIEEDPFNPWMRYMAAEALDFRSGFRASAAYYDQFLVLRGIRYYEHRTIQADDLVFAEERAIHVITTGGRGK